MIWWFLLKTFFCEIIFESGMVNSAVSFPMIFFLNLIMAISVQIPSPHRMMLFLMPQSTARTCTCRFNLALGALGVKISFSLRDTSAARFRVLGSSMGKSLELLLPWTTIFPNMEPLCRISLVTVLAQGGWRHKKKSWFYGWEGTNLTVSQNLRTRDILYDLILHVMWKLCFQIFSQHQKPANKIQSNKSVEGQVAGCPLHRFPECSAKPTILPGSGCSYSERARRNSPRSPLLSGESWEIAEDISIAPFSPLFSDVNWHKAYNNLMSNLAGLLWLSNHLGKLSSSFSSEGTP